MFITNLNFSSDWTFCLYLNNISWLSGFDYLSKRSSYSRANAIFYYNDNLSEEVSKRTRPPRLNISSSRRMRSYNACISSSVYFCCGSCLSLMLDIYYSAKTYCNSFYKRSSSSRSFISKLSLSIDSSSLSCIDGLLTIFLARSANRKVFNVSVRLTTHGEMQTTIVVLWLPPIESDKSFVSVESR